MQAALNISLRLALFNMAKNVTEERDELRRINSDIEASCKNLTEERDDLKRKLNDSVSQQNSLTEERDELRRINSDIEASCKNLTEERDDLKRKLTNSINMAKNVTEERDELRRINSDIEASRKNLTEERDDLKRKLNDSVSQQNSLTEERDELRRINSDIEASRKNLTEERDDLKRKLNDSVSQQNSLTEERDKLNRAIQGCRMELEKLSPARWMYFRGSFYHISSDQKTWQESRRDCQQKDADLVIINSKEEQDFTRQFQKYMWIGLTDLQTEGTWKWVDGTPVTKSYWGPKEPNGGSGENCGEMKFDSENSWNDGSCSLSHFWMCEKKVRP
ncbi:CD209 antigen-like [Epinephelus moara]|uniref:CD209 antigen-like n=1 Tax=Epinephelus moara TaxID=300413 RepID=UPI00214F1336|nr:CD209 antigen-like [Epinephelus moara]